MTESEMAFEIARLRLKLTQVAQKSNRRRSAIKQLQKALLLENFRCAQYMHHNAALRQEIDHLREEKGTAYRQMREQFNAMPWLYRLFGRA